MTNEVLSDGWIVFDRVAIDLAGRRVFVNEQVAALEPKAFAVLSLLAQQPGRVLTRDQILDAVWGHRHVTSGVLNRVMTLIRQALKEDGQEHQYLHTLYGVGYRFDAAVRFSSEQPDVPTTVSDVPQKNVAYVQTSTQPAEGSIAAVDHPRTDSAFHRSTRWRWLFVALTILVLVALVWTFYGTKAGVTITSSSASPTLVVLPLHAVDGDAEERNFSAGLGEELITRLAHIEGLRLISATSARRAAQDGLGPAELAQNLHITHALEGSLRQKDDLLRIDLRLLEIASGRTLWAQSYDRRLADIFSLQREIAQAVASALVPTLGLVDVTDSTVDPQVFREYLQARAKFRSESLSIFRKDAVSAFRAIALRAPGYAQVHATLALALATNLSIGTVSVAEIDEATREAGQALKISDDIAEAHTALAVLACRRGDWTSCMAEFHRAVALDTADSQTRALFAYWLVGLGYLTNGLHEVETGWVSDPLGFQTNFVRGRILDTLGRHDDAKIFFDNEANQRNVAATALVYARWFNAVWRHDYTSASERVVDIPREDGFHDAYALVTKALVEPNLWSEAKQAIASSEANTGKFNFLRLLEQGEDIPTSIDRLEQTLRAGFPSYYMMIWQPEYIELRKHPAFQDFLHRTRLLEYWRNNGWPSQCRPEGEGARCD